VGSNLDWPDVAEISDVRREAGRQSLARHRREFETYRTSSMQVEQMRFIGNFGLESILDSQQDRPRLALAARLVLGCQ